MKDLLRDSRVRRLLVANTLGSIGAGVTIFSVPWLMVHQAGGAEAYRWATIGTTIVLFFVMPYYGAWVDRHSRKTALLASESWGCAATLTMAIVGLTLGGFGLWPLVITYFCGMLYYTLHYPARFALIQQMFNRSQYQSLTGLLEIQGQTAMMIAGGLGGVLVEHVPLWTILLLNAATYLASFLIQTTLPYEATHLERATPAGNPGLRPDPLASAPGKSGLGPAPLAIAGAGSGQRPELRRGASVWSSIADGWRWLRERPRLTVFLTCSLLPFVIVMAANYLFPIYVAQTLNASAVYFAGGEITFAAGAILAGFLLPRLIAQHSASRTIPLTMLIFGAGLLVVILVRLPLAYLAAGALLGFGNAGCRVARSALLLNLVPMHMMGRVGGFYNVIDRVLRTTLVFTMGIIDTHGPPAGFVLLAGVLLLALVGIYQSRGAVQAAASAAEDAATARERTLNPLAALEAASPKPPKAS